MKTDIIYDVPIWASLYIMYGEDDNLSVEDKEQCDAFLTALKEDGVIHLIEPADCSEQVFNKYPAFGKPCSTQDWIAAIEEDKMKCPRYCEDEKLRKYNLHETNCEGDYKHCGNVITFGSQKYCGYAPSPCTIWQIVRSQAGCWCCVYSIKNLNSRICSDCLSKPTRVFKKYDEYWIEKCKREGISIESIDR